MIINTMYKPFKAMFWNWRIVSTFLEKKNYEKTYTCFKMADTNYSNRNIPKLAIKCLLLVKKSLLY